MRSQFWGREGKLDATTNHLQWRHRAIKSSGNSVGVGNLKEEVKEAKHRGAAFRSFRCKFVLSKCT